MCVRLAANFDHQLGPHSERIEVRRQGAEQHVALTLNLTDLRLSDTKIGSEFDLRAT
jgi:hypothetical protein